MAYNVSIFATVLDALEATKCQLVSSRMGEDDDVNVPGILIAAPQ